MFQRMVAVPFEEYTQLSGNSRINQVKQPHDQQFHDLEKEYTKQDNISDPFRRMMLQGETIDEMKTLKEKKMRNMIAANSPKPYRTRANALYQGLEPFLKFNERGEIFDDEGKLVPDSHIEDLIQYAVRDRRRDIIPKGWQSFTSILRKHNVPRYTLNRLTLDEIDGRSSANAAVKTPFIFSGKTPVSRREDSGTTAKQSARWGLHESALSKKGIDADFTPKKSGRQRRHSDSDITPVKKQSGNSLDKLKRTIADFDMPLERKKRILPARRHVRPKRYRMTQDY